MTPATRHPAAAPAPPHSCQDVPCTWLGRPSTTISPRASKLIDGQTRKRDGQRATFSGIAAARRRPLFDPIGRPQAGHQIKLEIQLQSRFRRNCNAAQRESWLRTAGLTHLGELIGRAGFKSESVSDFVAVSDRLQERDRPNGQLAVETRNLIGRGKTQSQITD